MYEREGSVLVYERREGVYVCLYLSMCVLEREWIWACEKEGRLCGCKSEERERERRECVRERGDPNCPESK